MPSGQCWWLLLLFSRCVLGQSSANDSSDGSLPDDPYLAYQPEFARSLPIQILITGIMLTLCCILLLNLLFTYQFHWPLSRLNYGLQLTGTTSMMLIFIMSLHVILTTAAENSREWPYMLDYVAIDIPPAQWNGIAIAWWYGLVALAAGIIHITHIQFLTILYPSSLEAKLILGLLGPLALLSAITELLPLQHTYEPPNRLIDLSDSIQSICNSTLSLLYTIALCVWGFIVNRSQAWRPEGGTAAFGGSAMLLATTSTVLSFLQATNKGPYTWLPCLLHTAVVWQNFVGWWWWVGAGMDDAYVDSFKERDRKQQAKNKLRSSSTGYSTQMQGSIKSGLWNRSRRVPAEQEEDSNDLHQEDSVETSSTTETVVDPVIGSDASAISDSTSPNKETRIGFGLAYFWDALRRAHRHAVRLQSLERIAVRTRRQQRGSGIFSNSSGLGNDGDIPLGMVSPLAQAERDMRKRREAIATGKSVWWWGPFGKWRFRDRTVY